jgi:hypothetical protein
MSRGPHGPRHGVREQIDLSMALEGPSFLLLSQTCPASSTSLHHYRPGLASERLLLHEVIGPRYHGMCHI